MPLHVLPSLQLLAHKKASITELNVITQNYHLVNMLMAEKNFVKQALTKYSTPVPRELLGIFIITSVLFCGDFSFLLIEMYNK